MHRALQSSLAAVTALGIAFGVLLFATQATASAAAPGTAGGSATNGSSLNAVLSPAGTTAALCVSGAGDLVAVGLDPLGSNGGCTQSSALIEIGPPSSLSVSNPGTAVSGVVGSTSDTVALCIDGAGNTIEALPSLNGRAHCGSGSALIQVGPAPLSASASTITRSVTVAPQSLTANATLCVAGTGTVSTADASTNTCAADTTQISVGPVSATSAADAAGSGSPVPATASLCVDSSGDVSTAASNAEGSATICNAGSASIQVGPA